MDRKDIPYSRTVFVCTNSREMGRIACANPGREGKAICDALKEEVKKAGLKGKVRVARSGCLDLCEKGPNLFIYPDNEWRSGVSLADVPSIVEKLKNA